MVNTLSGSVSAYRKENVKPRFIRIDEVMALLDVTRDEAMDIALAAGARYQLAKIILVHKERLMKFMKHSARVPSSNKIVEKKFVRIGEGSMTYSIGHHRFIEMARAAGAVYKIGEAKDNYDYILIDCMPSLGMITINAFACADSILIPVQAAYLPAKGLQQLIKTIGKVRRQINPKLTIEGILLTMVDARTNYAKDITALLVENYGSKVRIFENSIPISVRAAEISAEGVSIYEHDPKGKVAAAYQSLTEEVLGNE